VFRDGGYAKAKGIMTNVCLHQLRTIDYRRLSSKMGSLDDSDFQKVKEGFRKLYSL
jgi:mRNA-degrading endonuclease toxin of MazEF toxin-antitoxin module